MSFNNSLSSREFEEKRDHIRMRVDSPVEMYLRGGTQPLSGICRDLSGGGMLIEVNAALQVGTQLEVILASNHGHAPMLRAKATVCRISAQPTSEQLPNVVGLRLRNILL